METERKKLPIIIMIEEEVLTNVLERLPIDDIYNFCKAYPHFDPDGFSMKLFCKKHNIHGEIKRHSFVENRPWKSLCSIEQRLFSENAIIPNVNSNRFGVEIFNNTINNTNRNTDGKNAVIARDKVSSKKWWTTICINHQENLLLMSPIMYYEVKVNKQLSGNTSKFVVSIGLVTNRDYSETSMIGWRNGSIAIHSDDGNLFHENGSGTDFTAPFNTGAVIGVGYIPETRQVFFTKDGKKIKERYINTTFEEVYPAIGVKTSPTLEVNFGMKKFEFDLLKEIEEYYSK